MANYYDKILEDFDVNESIYDEGIFDEGILDEGLYDEGILDEARSNKRYRPTKVQLPNSVQKKASFGRNIPPPSSNGGVATKSELRSSLNSISDQVNDLKKSSLSLASSIKSLDERVKRLDDGYEKVVKTIAKKDRAQDNVMSSSTMMSLMGTLVNKPTLNTDALTIERTGTGTNQKEQIKVVDGQDPINVDLTKTMLFTMMPMMMSSNGSSGDNNSNMMMMLMMVLLLNNNNNNNSGSTGNNSNNNNTMLMMIPMMMMMNKK